MTLDSIRNSCDVWSIHASDHNLWERRRRRGPKSAKMANMLPRLTLNTLLTIGLVASLYKSTYEGTLWHHVSVFLQFFVFLYLWENHREYITKLGNKTATMLTATSNVSSISHWLNLAESIMLNQFVWNRMLWLTHFKSVSMGTLIALLGCAEWPRTTNVYLSALLDDPSVNQLWNWYSIVWEGF